MLSQVVSVLKKEAIKTNTGSTAGEQEDAARYRQLLVRALHQCAIRYPNVAASTIPLVSDSSECSDITQVTHLLTSSVYSKFTLSDSYYCLLVHAWLLQLCEMLTDSKEEAASDVLLFLREAVHKFEQLRAPVIGRLLDSLSALKSPKYCILHTFYSNTPYYTNNDSIEKHTS